MVTTVDVPVPQPVKDFGAVMGKNRYGRWLIILPVYVALFVFTVVAYHVPNFLNDFDADRQTSVAGLALGATVIGGLVFLFYTYHVFTYAAEMFRQDMEAGRDRYAATEFRAWLNNRYGVTFSKDAAIDLVRGRTAYVTRAREAGGTERVQVYLDGIEPLVDVIGTESVGEVPDVSHLHEELTLMIVETPAKPRVRVWEA